MPRNNNTNNEILETDDSVGGSFFFMSYFFIGLFLFLILYCINLRCNCAYSIGVMISAIICLISVLNYKTKKEIWFKIKESNELDENKKKEMPVVYNYLEWTITFPLLSILLFILICHKFTFDKILFLKLLIIPFIMFAGLFLGESKSINKIIDNDLINFIVAILIYFIGLIYLLKILWFEVSLTANALDINPLILKILKNIITFGWSIYPLQYIYNRD